MYGGTSDPTLQVMAERPDTRQLTIEDCAALSRRISDAMDALEAAGRDPIDHAYRLEVSSPGIDRPLTRIGDFADWTGHEARITLSEKLDGRKQFKGDLTGLDGDRVGIIDPQGVRHWLPFALVEDAKLVMTDRLIAATQPLSAEGADKIIEEEV
jgi:ribosome maturation factor RimP